MNVHQTDWGSAQKQGHENALAILHRLLRGRYAMTILLALGFGVAGGMLGYISRQPQYESTGIIRIQPTLPKVLYDSEQSAVPKMFSSFVNSQAQLISQGGVIQRALDSDEWRQISGLTDIVTAIDVQKRLKVRADRQAQEIITVSFSHTNPQVSSTIVRAVMESYIEEFGGEGSIKNPEIVSALNQRKDDLIADRKGYDTAITRIAESFRTENLKPLIDNALYTVRLLEAQRDELVDQRAMYAQFKNINAISNSEILTLEEASTMDPMLAGMVARGVDLVGLRDEMMDSEGLRGAHRDVQRITSMIESNKLKMDNRLEELRTGVSSSQLVDEEGKPVPSEEILTYKISRIDQQIKDTKDKSEDLYGANVRLNTLREDRKNVQDSISAVIARLDQIKTESQVIDMKQVAGKISIPRMPRPALEPTSDPRKKMAAAGFVVSSSVPVMIILAFGFLSDRVRYSNDDILSSTGAGIIGLLPDMGDALTDQEIASASAFAVHQIRSQLQIKNVAGDSQVYGVTSPAPQDGKTSLIIALGLSYAESGEKTLLLDLDLIGRGLSVHFGYPSAPSLANSLKSFEQIDSLIHETDFDGLSILPAGFGDDQRISQLSPKAVGGLVEHLRKKYDTILIDTGPILGSVEAAFVAPQSDGVILVIGRGQLKPLIKKAISQIQGVDGKIIATIFNRALIQELRQSASSMSVHFSRQMSRQQDDVQDQRRGWGGPIAGALCRDKAIKGEHASDKGESS